MKTHTDFNKHTDMTQDDKIFRMSRNEAEEACLQSPISAWEILYRARQNMLSHKRNLENWKTS